MARAADSSQLVGYLVARWPVICLLSVCPSIRITFPLRDLNVSIILLRTAIPSGFTSALPESNSTDAFISTVNLPRNSRMVKSPLAICSFIRSVISSRVLLTFLTSSSLAFLMLAICSLNFAFSFSRSFIFWLRLVIIWFFSFAVDLRDATRPVLLLMSWSRSPQTPASSPVSFSTLDLRSVFSRDRSAYLCCCSWRFLVRSFASFSFNLYVPDGTHPPREREKEIIASVTSILIDMAVLLVL